MHWKKLDSSTWNVFQICSNKNNLQKAEKEGDEASFLSCSSCHLEGFEKFWKLPSDHSDNSCCAVELQIYKIAYSAALKPQWYYKKIKNKYIHTFKDGQWISKLKLSSCISLFTLRCVLIWKMMSEFFLTGLLYWGHDFWWQHIAASMKKQIFAQFITKMLFSHHKNKPAHHALTKRTCFNETYWFSYIAWYVRYMYKQHAFSSVQLYSIYFFKPDSDILLNVSSLILINK